MSSQARLSPRAAVVMGSAISAMGLLIILLAVGIVPVDERSLEAPRWVVACAGLAFVLGGAAVMIGYAVAGGVGPDGDLTPGTPLSIRIAQYTLGLGVAGSMAAIMSWIAFGPGPRTFTATGPFLSGRATSETTGRVVFGIAAVLIYIFLAVLVVVSIRRLRRAK
jgi:hypothetical protein